MSDQIHQADDSYVGYVFQGQFALILLLDAKDGEAVSVETQDDVVLEGETVSLYQLKHSLKDTKQLPRLTITNTGLWKTIFIWANTPDICSKKFIFVTATTIAPDSSLSFLNGANGDWEKVASDLLDEAKRVLDEVQVAKSAGKKSIPHKNRLSGCRAYFHLTPQQRRDLVNRITIRPENFNALQVEDEVEIRLAKLVPPDMRKQIVNRLLEWGDRRITLALLGKQPRLITKKELLDKITELIAEHYDMSLPDDYSRKKPDPSEVAKNGMMERQIELVQGGNSRIQRAKIARWRAMNQRSRWIDEDFSRAATLADFDQQLIEEWKDLFGPMRDDCEGEPEHALCEQGRILLDWSHKDAPNQIPAIVQNWTQPFLVRGSYQELANEKKVGWHPEFEKRLSNKD